MPRVIEPQHAEPIVRALLGSIDLGDGGPHEQRSVVAAFVHGYWGRDDLDIDAPDLELTGRLRAMQDLPEGTLGHEYFSFLDRHGFEFPGETTMAPAVFVAHDTCHVMTGYETSGEEEIAVNSMQLSLNDSDAHWLQLLGSLSIHEAGFFSENGFVPKTGTLDRDGAAAVLAEAFRRGAACTADYTKADHLALAEQPLEDVRTQFGIPPRRV